MNKINWLLLSLFFVTSAGSITAQPKLPAVTTNNSTDLSFLKKLEGKYSADLLEHPKLKARLKKMMEFNHYDFVNKEVWQTLMPNKIEGNYFIAEAMQLHSGGDPAACIIVDLNTNLIYVGVRDQIEYVYTEKGTEIPEIVKKWAINTYPPKN
jgi:hypothetical protein